MVFCWFDWSCCCKNCSQRRLLGLSGGHSWTEALCEDEFARLAVCQGHSGCNTVTGVKICRRDKQRDSTLLGSLQKEPIDCQNFFLICLKTSRLEQLYSDYFPFCFVFLVFYSFNHSRTVSLGFYWDPILYCNICICWYVHVSKLFHLVCPLKSSLNSWCTWQFVSDSTNMNCSVLL